MIYAMFSTYLKFEEHHARCTTESYDTGSIVALIVDSSLAYLVAISNKRNTTGDQENDNDKISEDEEYA
jgi:hypothetical protein